MHISRLLWLPVLALAACSSVAPTPAPISNGNALPQSAPLAGNGSVRYLPTRLNALPAWNEATSADSLAALRQSCRSLARKPGWNLACQNLTLVNASDTAAVRNYFEQHFDAWQLQADTHDRGLITGYYEPMLNGSRARSERTPWPVYGVPADLVSVDISAAERTQPRLVMRKSGARWLAVAGKSAPDGGERLLDPADFPPGNKLKARVAGDRLLPYYTRAELEAGRLAGAPVLAWVDDATELFFLQVQGSGRIHLEDGSVLRVNAADSNGQPYQSIGRWLITQGKLSAGQATLPGIQAWLREHPDERQALFNRNPRYIFFRPLQEQSGGPTGSLGVALTGGYSLAVDPHYIPLGAPVFVATTWPKSNTPLNRLMNAQDTGAAIKGALRADFFWGYGDAAGLQAGSMKQQGQLWLLLPKGMQPNAAF